MKKTSWKSTNKSVLFVTVGILILFIVSLTFLHVGTQNSMQSVPTTVAGISFKGEYKIGDGEWQEINKENHIPSTKGDVTLKGTFILHNPETGEAMSSAKPGMTVSLYFNHIGGHFVLPNGSIHKFDVENEVFGEDACAVMWGYAYATGDDPITIVLQNPHTYGNENAIDDFLNNMSAASSGHLDKLMLEKGESQRNTGLLIFIVSLIILGIALFSTIIRVKRCIEIWLMGLMSLSAGGYMLFGAFAVSIWNNSNITNTGVLGLSMMFYMLFYTMLITSLLRKHVKKIAKIATLISGITVLLCVLISLSEKIKFYDTWLWWANIEILVILALIACMILSLKKTTVIEKCICITNIIALLAFPLDCVATKIGWWQGGIASAFVFFVLFVMVVLIVLLIIPTHINAAFRARELEVEKQLLKQELKESRISIVLSQMQPHFIFNALNTIYHLCDIDPSKAKSTISSFSGYLRNNIDNLGQSEMIAFEKELSFVKTYLDIEKVRFDDELIISFDIGVSNFKLPVLTVQPIVENAVKHGTSKKEGVSYLYISTRELDDCYEIEIRDTGVGFDSSEQQNDGHKHIGITSATQRLDALCGGTLTIESQPGVGTTATIRIPKGDSV